MFNEGFIRNIIARLISFFNFVIFHYIWLVIDCEEEFYNSWRAYMFSDKVITW